MSSRRRAISTIVVLAPAVVVALAWVLRATSSDGTALDGADPGHSLDDAVELLDQVLAPAA